MLAVVSKTDLESDFQQCGVGHNYHCAAEAYGTTRALFWELWDLNRSSLSFYFRWESMCGGLTEGLAAARNTAGEFTP